MTTPDAADPGPEPPGPPAAPTVRVGRPPVPGRAPRPAPADPDAPPAREPVRDETTVELPDRAPGVRQRTLEFGTPEPVAVTVGPRPRRRRRYRTWPWIAALVVALLVLGVVLLVMLLRGATIDDDVDLVGGARSSAAGAVPGTVWSPDHPAVAWW